MELIGDSDVAVDCCDEVRARVENASTMRNTLERHVGIDGRLLPRQRAHVPCVAGARCRCELE